MSVFDSWPTRQRGELSELRNGWKQSLAPWKDAAGVARRGGGRRYDRTNDAISLDQIVRFVI